MNGFEGPQAVASVVEWFRTRIGDSMTVQVITGDETRTVATGPLLALEEHPTSPGVYRAIFDDSLSGGAGATQFVAFGHEVVGAEMGDAEVTLDKGTQRIHVTDHPRAQTATPVSAEDVVWPEEQRAQPPGPPVVAPPPPPAPPVAPPPLTPPAPPVAPPLLTPPAPPVAPPVAPPPLALPYQPAPVAADGLTMTVSAPLYGNAMASGFFGDVNLDIRQGWVTITGMRARQKGQMLVGGMLLLVLGVLGLLLGVTLSTNPDSEHMGAICGMSSLLMIAIGLALYLVGRSKVIRSGERATVQFELSRARGRRVRYDSNLGCLLMLVATPVIGLIVMLAMGRRVVRMSAPIAPDGRDQVITLRARSSADGAVLDRALIG